MKLPFWLRSLLFFIAFVCVYIPLDILLVHGFASEVPLIEHVIDEQDTFDIAVMGSSHAYCGYDPRILNEALVDSHTENLSIAALSFEHISLLLKDMIAEEKQPEVLVLEMYSFRQPPNAHTQTVFFNGYSKTWRPDTLVQLFSDYPSKEWIYTLFPLIYQHDNWKNNDLLNRNLDNFWKKDTLTIREIVYTRGLFDNGFRPNPLVISDQEFSQAVSNPVNITLETSNVKSFERILEMSSENEIELIFIIAPYPEGFHADYSAMEEIEEKYGITIHNFNEKAAAYKQLQFLDDDHLNQYGAIQASLELAAIIAEETGRELANENITRFQHLMLSDIMIENIDTSIQLTLIPELPQKEPWDVEWVIFDEEGNQWDIQTVQSLSFSFPSALAYTQGLKLQVTYQQAGLDYPAKVIFNLVDLLD